MIIFNRNDGADIQEQLTYLNSLPQYKLFRLRAVKEQMKTYDFWNEKCIIEFKKRTCNHDTFPDFILQKDKYDMNMELAKKHKISFYYQNKYHRCTSLSRLCLCHKLTWLPLIYKKILTKNFYFYENQFAHFH